MMEVVDNRKKNFDILLDYLQLGCWIIIFNGLNGAMRCWINSWKWDGLNWVKFIQSVKYKKKERDDNK